LITAALGQLGHEVIAAKSGIQAIDLYTAEKPDLIILDVMMQGMDGFECAKKIRAIECQEWIPIIFLSGSVDDISIAKGIDAGGDDYLTKPFSQITLAAKIKAMQRISDMRKKLYDATCKLGLLSSTDTLTGIYNRLQFNTSIKEKLAYAKRHNTMLALLFIDLDNFKLVNDHFGHHAGDLLLQDTTERLKTCIREYDFLARLGGDEFAIILSDIKSVDDAANVAQKILSKLYHNYSITNHNFTVGCSIGIACYPTDAQDEDTLIQNADMAMYRAKELGRNNFQCFTRELLKTYSQEGQLKNDLHDAIAKDQLILLYDPIINLTTNKVESLEVLLRWNHPELGVILPKQFIPMAEAIGLINAIDEWVIRTACAQAQQWRANEHHNIKVSVNISHLELLRGDFAEIVEQILKETRLSPQLLELELDSIQPTTLASNIIAEKIIISLAKLGVNISIDDYGIGCAPLIGLKSLPIKTLKINSNFIADLLNDDNDAKIVKSIIALGNSLQLNVIAEGITSAAQLELLHQANCHYGQGKYLSDILDASQVDAYLQKNG
jgi:diguanylate cyclase (GGDEF)-like protein